MAEQWGHFDITLGQAIRKKGYDRDKLAYMANVQKNQLNQYIGNSVKRPDLNVLARICAVLGCDIGDILKYVPPNKPIAYKTGSEKASHDTTGHIARELSVHPNTIRFYERIGLIASVPRSANGYRRFTHRHRLQLRVLRTIFSDPYTNKTLRKSAFTIVFALKEWDLIKALSSAEGHKRLVEKEYAAALETAALLKSWTEEKVLPTTGATYSHKEAAHLLGVTPEVLRNWERNGLIRTPRNGRGNARVYGDIEIARLRIIYMLRQNNYSIAAIQRSLFFFDSGNSTGVLLALNQPPVDTETEYINARDHWLETLGVLSVSAEKIRQRISDELGKGSS